VTEAKMNGTHKSHNATLGEIVPIYQRKKPRLEPEKLFKLEAIMSEF
jgi:hypothetical protein